MNWYHVYHKDQLPNVPWNLYQQFVRWNLAATEFILEYKHEPADKTGVLTRDEAAAYTKNTDWEVYDIYPNVNNGEG